MPANSSTLEPAEPEALGLEIAAMAPEHLDQVESIEKKSFSLPWSRRLFEAEIANQHALPLVALTLPSRRVAGYLCLWLAADEVQVQNLAVHPEARGRGVGRLLLVQGLITARRKGAFSASLEVRPSNMAARKLYAGLGFKQVGRRPRYYQPEGEDAMVLALDISGWPNAASPADKQAASKGPNPNQA